MSPTAHAFELDTAADMESVIAYLADFRNQEQWRDDVLQCTVVSGEPGEDGTVYRQHVRQGPGHAWRDIHAEVHEGGRRIAFRTVAEAPLRAHGHYRVEPVEEGTHVEVTFDFEVVGKRGVVLWPLVSRTIPERTARYATVLQSRLEELAGGHPGKSARE